MTKELQTALVAARLLGRVRTERGELHANFASPGWVVVIWDAELLPALEGDALRFWTIVNERQRGSCALVQEAVAFLGGAP